MPHVSSRSRPPWFTPVRLRARRGGWSAEVQCAFLAQLYFTGSPAAAARRVGRSRESAHRLRKRPDAESFAAAWDRILEGPAAQGECRARQRRVADWRKVTLEQLHWRMETGLWRPAIYRGRMCGFRRKPDNSALLRLIGRLDARTRGIMEAEL